MSARERLRAVRAGEKNVGGTERFIRATLGPTLIVVGIAAIAGFVTLASGLLGLALGIVVTIAGLRMSQSAITQRCYMNALIGRNSCKTNSVPSSPNTDADVQQ